MSCISVIKDLKIVQAAAASVSHLGALSENVGHQLPREVLEALAGCLRVKPVAECALGDLVALPSEPLPVDPVAAYSMLVQVPLVGAVVRQLPGDGSMEVEVERWPRGGFSAAGGAEAAWFLSRRVIVPAGVEGNSLAICVVNPDLMLMPAAGAASVGGKFVRTVGENEGVVGTPEGKPVLAFIFKDEDGGQRRVQTKGDAYVRYERVRGLLRVWSPNVVEAFIWDLVLNSTRLFQHVSFVARTGPWRSVSHELFAGVQKIRDSWVLRDEPNFIRVIMARWSFCEGDRLRLVSFAGPGGNWPLRDEGQDDAGWMRLEGTLRLLSRILAAVWDESFKHVFMEAMELVSEQTLELRLYSVAYVVSRIEIAMSNFADVVFGPRRKEGGVSASFPAQGGGVVVKKCESPADWARLLTNLVTDAVNMATWEPAPTIRFYARGGEYDSFVHPRHGWGGPTATTGAAVVGKVAAVATPDRTGGDMSHKRPGGPPASHEEKPDAALGSSGADVTKKARLGSAPAICQRALAAYVKFKGEDGKVEPCPFGNKCRYSHDTTAMKMLTTHEAIAVCERMPSGKKEKVVECIGKSPNLFK